jgi:hypothetical protein
MRVRRYAETFSSSYGSQFILPKKAELTNYRAHTAARPQLVQFGKLSARELSALVYQNSYKCSGTNRTNSLTRKTEASNWFRVGLALKQLDKQETDKTKAVDK